MAAIDIAAKVRSAALAAIEKQCFGEDFGVDAAVGVVPSPTSGAMVVYTIIVTKKSPLLGQGPLVHVVQLPSPDPTTEQVEQAVTVAMSGLRDLSTKILTGDHTASLDAR